MNRLRQYALPRQHGRSRRDLHMWRRRLAAKHLLTAAAVALAVLPLSACSDGGGKIIRSWLLKQDGVEKVKTSCETHDETGCYAIATTTLSDDTEPDQACTFLNRVATELPRHDELKERIAYIQLTWKYHGPSVFTKRATLTSQTSRNGPWTLPATPWKRQPSTRAALQKK